MSKQTTNTNTHNFSTLIHNTNNTGTSKTALNNSTSTTTNRHLTASHPNHTIKSQINRNPHLKKLNQQSHSDSSNSFIRQEIMVK